MSPSAPPPAVALDAISKSFGARRAVREVSFTVGAGVCFGLLGPNGAGKSTTLKMVYGFLRPDSGRVEVNGADVARDPRRARAMLGIAPQEDLLDPELSVLGNLAFHARYHAVPRARIPEACRRLLREAALEGHEGAKVAHLSAGLRRRLVLARALLTSPPIVILDEPTRGLDQESRRGYLETLLRLKARGTTLLLATHDLLEAEILCDRAAIMAEGALREEGSIFDVLGAYRGCQPEPAEAAC